MKHFKGLITMPTEQLLDVGGQARQKALLEWAETENNRMLEP